VNLRFFENHFDASSLSLLCIVATQSVLAVRLCASCGCYLFLPPTAKKNNVDKLPYGMYKLFASMDSLSVLCPTLVVFFNP
jgi:hypothetical protein